MARAESNTAFMALGHLCLSMEWKIYRTNSEFFAAVLGFSNLLFCLVFSLVSLSALLSKSEIRSNKIQYARAASSSLILVVLMSLMRVLLFAELKDVDSIYPPSGDLKLAYACTFLGPFCSAFTGYMAGLFCFVLRHSLMRNPSF